MATSSPGPSPLSKWLSPPAIMKAKMALGTRLVKWIWNSQVIRISGKVGHFARDKVCPARGKTCARCGEKGHRLGQLVVGVRLRGKRVVE